MSDARRSPIPQDRVNENVDEGHRAQAAKAEQRHVERRQQEEREATNPEQQPGIPDAPNGPAEGGD
jgi:hypothetical protein